MLVPAEALDGDSDVATVTAASLADPLETAASELTTTADIPTAYGVELAPAEAAGSGAPGETVMYTLQLTNTGEITNTFAVTYTGNLWDVHLVETSFELGAGESAELAVHVMIPADAAVGTFDAVTVEVSGEGEVTAASELTTTAVIKEFKVFLPLVPQAFEQE